MDGKRNIIPIDFGDETVEQLEREAEALGLNRCQYIKMLITTHQDRVKPQEKAS